MASPAEACRVNFQSDLFSYAAVGSTMWLARLAGLLSPTSGTGGLLSGTDGIPDAAPPVAPKSNWKERVKPNQLTIGFSPLQGWAGSRLGWSGSKLRLGTRWGVHRGIGAIRTSLPRIAQPCEKFSKPHQGRVPWMSTTEENHGQPGRWLLFRLCGSSAKPKSCVVQEGLVLGPTATCVMATVL